MPETMMIYQCDAKGRGLGHGGFSKVDTTAGGLRCILGVRCHSPCGRRSHGLDIENPSESCLATEHLG